MPGGIWCLSCFNRTREVAEWRNARHGPPAHAGRTLRWVYALLRVPAEAMLASRYRINRQCAPRRPGLPNPTEYADGGVFWVSTIMAGADEFEAWRMRTLPDAEVLELEVCPTFAEIHSTPSDHACAP